MRSVSASVKRLLLVIAVVILAVYAIVQAINRPVSGEAQTYHAQFTDAFGLRENGDVRVRGVQVGKVLGIELKRSGIAEVEFTVRNQDRLTEQDELAIRFQNLVGQRYLAILGPEEQANDSTVGADHQEDEAVGNGAGKNGTGKNGTGENGAAFRDPDQVIPVSETTGSFDITRLFNGMRPILRGADPEVFNTFAENMIHLLQGEDGVGIGDVLKDVERLTQFATDKNALIRVIIDNLGVVSEQLTGKSAIIESLMANMQMLFDTLEQNLELLKGAFGEGSQVFPPIVEIMKHTFDLSLGGHDRVQARLMELAPETGNLADALEVVPTMLSGINGQLDRLGVDPKCSRGEVPLPAMGDVLLGGEKVTLCKA